jgi:hypothetical protein
MGKITIIDIRNNGFTPTTIQAGTYAVWRNLDPYPHSAETLPDSATYFNAGALLPGATSSPVYFARPGDYQYICRFHMGMTGLVRVVETLAKPAEGSVSPQHADSHCDEHMHHLHGFVTGGRSGRQIFMTHTPVIADERHHFQVILQGRFVQDTHVAAYDALRRSSYQDGKVGIFHDHVSLEDIGEGKIKSLPHSWVEYYPDKYYADGADGPLVPGLEKDVAVQIDKVLHFHQFESDADYPAGLEYLIYGNSEDIFIDHYINRAPSFHTVAKLSKRPDFWTGSAADVMKILIPTKRIREVEPKFLSRVAFVDNSFHVFWLPPPGVYPQIRDDPLMKRDGTAPAYDVLLDDGTPGHIEIGRFLHFDIRLLNYGVLIP